MWGFVEEVIAGYRSMRISSLWDDIRHNVSGYNLRGIAHRTQRQMMSKRCLQERKTNMNIEHEFQWTHLHCMRIIKEEGQKDFNSQRPRKSAVRLYLPGLPPRYLSNMAARIRPEQGQNQWPRQHGRGKSPRAPLLDEEL